MRFENYSNKEIKDLYKQMDVEEDRIQILKELTTYSKNKLKVILRG
jgi:hypothetical protein